MQLFPFLSPALFLAYPLTVSGSLSNSYVKFPIQKAADIPELQDASGFFKRSDDLNSTLINTLNSGMYVVKMEIGTPPQPVYLQVDTGSSDMYVNVADSAYCKSISEGSDYASTDNYELTATFTGLPSTTISSETYNTLCSYWGTFSPSNSSTFKYNQTFFNETYGDGTYYAGTYGTDVVSFDNISLHNFTFGVSNDTTNNNGILGVSIPSAEFTDTLPYTSDFDVTPHTYDNFPIALKDQGKIEKIAYSLFLNEPNAHFGSILFGAVDKSKYSGQLYTLPMLEAYNNLDSLNQGMFVTAQSVAILDGKSGNKTVSDVRFPVLFDSGTTFSTLPTEIADAIGKSFDGKYNSRDQGYIFDCSKVNDTLLSVDFGGFNISANISNFVTPAKDHCLLNIVPTDTGVVLGDAFLVDAYVVYDLESREVSIAQANFNDQVENIEIISDSVPGATPAPGYSNTWEYTPGSPIGTGDFYNVSWTSYSELSQYASNFATESVSDEFSSSSSGESSSHKSTKRENLGYKCCRSSFSFSLLSFVSYFLL
ncbi:CQS_1a_G0006380.mRNA.1.CDS.1 [Saccharomyces cerevisiae]|nr:CQS_1a_G0006380.mRNA.1.CDS.1 [Saccharomyces cerevisiae]CAI7172882.1 CQS_1a_G0006380.mRNA.1.CDS.1 [Saccharomyces cerevisiae]